jgi:uncharacterized C2H2 Zn-finger protein
MHKCTTCNKIFKYLSDYNRHKNRKSLCNIVTLREDGFKCPKCYKSYATNGSLKRHMNGYCTGEISKDIKLSENISNNKHENPKMDKIEHNESGILSTEEESCNDDDFNCEYCNKQFTFKHNLKRHINDRCKIKKKLDDKLRINDDREQIYQKLIANMEKMQSEIDILKKEKQQLVAMSTESQAIVTINKNRNTTNITNNNNNVTNNINIQLVGYSKENNQSLTNSEIFKLMCKGKAAVPALIKAIHFDENKPENHNIYIPNMRDNFVMMYDGDNWGLVDRTEALGNILDDSHGLMVIKNEEMQDLYGEQNRKSIKKFNRFFDDLEDNDDKKSMVLNDIKMLLYNGKKMVMDTRKLIEQQELNKTIAIK